MALALELTLTTSCGDQTTRFSLSGQLMTIGRIPENDIQIRSKYISRKHATIEKRHGHVFIHDHSSSGTFLNGMRLVSGDRGAVLRYDDDIEFGVAPDHERTTRHPFRARATFRVTISSCTPLGQRNPLVQMSAPIPLAADLNPNPDSSDLPNPSASEAMEPPPKRLRPDHSIAAPATPPAAVLPSPAADLSAVAPPPAAEPLAEAPELGYADVLSQHWHVFGNDPNDSSGIRSVLLAEHSRGKPEAMVRNAFPSFSDNEVASFVQMSASDVFRFKKGGTVAESIADAETTCKKLIALADEYGSNLRVWGCGGGMDRIVQISSLNDFVQTANMRPLNTSYIPRTWEAIGIRPSPYKSTKCASVNLASSDDGSGTYRVEIWRNDACVTHFFLGIYPHPGSMSWGIVENRPREGNKFLRDLANGTPSQNRVIKVNADESSDLAHLTGRLCP